MAAVVLTRRVQWMDTDAAGIWHYSTIIRWAEEAEAELHRRAGVSDITFGATPRVHVEFDFRTPVRFDDEVSIEFGVDEMGESSIVYGLVVKRAGDEIARGRIIAAFIDRATGKKQAWPAPARQGLSRRD